MNLFFNYRIQLSNIEILPVVVIPNSLQKSTEGIEPESTNYLIKKKEENRRIHIGNSFRSD